MAKPQHIKLAKQGPEAWNQWRNTHPDEIPDFRGSDLRGVDFRMMNLGKADFSEADLTHANLCGVFLPHAVLVKAQLGWANFGSAHLESADLQGAFLRSTDVRLARLNDANLKETWLLLLDFDKAEFGAADFTGASINWCQFDDVDLSQVKGLETVKHIGPSTIGIDTIHRSGGRIPGSFLKGAGVPDAFIQYVALMAGESRRLYSCFISYSSQDQSFADRLYGDLQRCGVRCWFAPEHLKIGDPIRQAIDESIQQYDKLLLVLSERSIDSAWVEKEVETAFERERNRKTPVLFPIRLDDSVMSTQHAWAADIRRTRNIGDFSNWPYPPSYRSAFDRLLRDLEVPG